jgi:hypothetical protein
MNFNDMNDSDTKQGSGAEVAIDLLFDTILGAKVTFSNKLFASVSLSKMAVRPCTIMLPKCQQNVSVPRLSFVHFQFCPFCNDPDRPGISHNGVCSVFYLRHPRKSLTL